MMAPQRKTRFTLKMLARVLNIHDNFARHVARRTAKGQTLINECTRQTHYFWGEQQQFQPATDR